MVTVPGRRDLCGVPSFLHACLSDFKSCEYVPLARTFGRFGQQDKLSKKASCSSLAVVLLALTAELATLAAESVALAAELATLAAELAKLANGAMLLLHKAVNRGIKDSGREPSLHLRSFTRWNSIGLIVCRDWSITGFCFMSLFFISSSSSCISSFGGMMAHTGDGLAKDISSGLRTLGASLLCAVSLSRDQSTTALMLGQCFPRRGKSASRFSRGLCGLQ